MNDGEAGQYEAGSDCAGGRPQKDKTELGSDGGGVRNGLNVLEGAANVDGPVPSGEGENDGGFAKTGLNGFDGALKVGAIHPAARGDCAGGKPQKNATELGSDGGGVRNGLNVLEGAVNVGDAVLDAENEDGRQGTNQSLGEPSSRFDGSNGMGSTRVWARKKAPRMGSLG